MSKDPFSFMVSAAKIPHEGKRFHLEPDETQRRAMAAVLGIEDVSALAADLDVRAVGADDLAVQGRLTASIVQTDVITLEPLRQELSEEIDVTLVPADDSTARRRSDEPEEADREPDTDVYRGGQIDLGAIVFEHLALGLDLYPRSAGVEFPGHVEDKEDESTSPFAALKALKREQE